MTDLGRFRDRQVRVLVVKLSAMGDIIHVTGCLKALRHALPRARMTMAVEGRWRDVVAHNRHVDEIIESSAQDRLSLRYLWEIRRTLARRGPFDVAIDFQGNRRSAAWIYLSGAPVRLGRGRFRPGWQSAIEPDLSLHAVTVCAEICRSIGVTVPDPSPELHTGPAESPDLGRALSAAGLPSSGYVVLNPFSRWTSKSWPLDNAATVIRRLRRVTDRALVVSGGPGDRRGDDELRRLLGADAVPSLVGQLSLGNALCLLERARLVVSCDSGPMHAAAAFGVPVVALFGPTHPERTGPWGPRTRVLQAARPPSHHTYRSDPQASYMRRLDPEAVLAAVLEELTVDGENHP